VITEAGNDPKVAGTVLSAPLHRTKASPWPPLSKIRARRTCTADTASAGRLFVSRQDEVPRLLRSRCGRTGGRGCGQAVRSVLLIRDRSRMR
jgi:hypothetical protein